MYTSPDEARSDVMLAGAVFVFGPIVIGLLLTTLPLTRLRPLAVLIALATPVLLTAVVPYWLVRHRRESWDSYGFGGSPGSGLVSGALVASPMVAAGAVSALVGGQPLTAALPLLGAGPGWLLAMAVRVVTWLGLAILAVFVTTKARDAFRPTYQTIPEVMLDIGKVLGIVVAVAGLLRLVLVGTFDSVIMPLGVAASVWMLYQRARGPSSTSRATLLTPTVLLAIGSFFITLSAAQLVAGVWTAALVAAVGLAMGVLREQRRSAWAVIGLAVVIALLTPLPVPLRLGM